MGGWLGRWGGRVELAAVNGPSSVVVAGDPVALEELLVFGAERGVRVRRIAVDYASHTSQVEVLEGELAGLLGSVRARVPVVPFFSSVDGEWVRDERLGGGYWYRNLRQAVRFGDAVEALVGEGFRVFVESSAHPVLVTGVQDVVERAEGVSAVVGGSLRRGEGGLERFVASVSGLWVRGVDVDWSAVLPEPRGAGVELPTYAFQHQRYWLNSTPTKRSAPLEDLMTDTENDDQSTAPLGRTLAGLTDEEREAKLLERVRAEAAAVLGHEDAAPVEPGSVFFEVGFTSLTAVELRNRLSETTGFELPLMLLFDHPTPAALAKHLNDLCADGAPTTNDELLNREEQSRV
ncbi:acyltransferase domain-containing protein [Streptomyces sp. NPDC046465]|uniref:acyltransferase domain-containing protein n=1 Tax=Streptomyces sp. NPDC046465 TaxID=3155810 RepID=UPI003400BB7D